MLEASSTPREEEEPRRKSGPVVAAAAETTPLICGDAIDAPPADKPTVASPSAAAAAAPSSSSVGTSPHHHTMIGITLPENLRDMAQTQLQGLAQNAAKAKNSMKKSPWIVSIIVMACAALVAAAGAFGIITSLLTFHPVDVTLKIYQTIFGTITLAVEAVRYFPLFGTRPFIHRWVPFFELSVGRGLLQILAGGLTMTGKFQLGEAVPGLLLGVCGTFGIAWGVKSTLKARQLFHLLRLQAEGTAAARGESSSGIMLIQSKFAALDLNGDGRLSKDELERGCLSLNIQLDEGELDNIFRQLDPKTKGYIDIADFEVWWYGAKDISRFLA